LIENQATLLEIQAAQEFRVTVRNQFKVSEDDERKKRRLDVINWLAAVDSILDQEASSDIRREYPKTGKWILQETRIKAWLDPRNSVVRTMWINGIPGAGMECSGAASR